MPNHYFFHLLNTNPRYANSMHKLSYLNKHHNPKAHGGSAMRKYLKAHSAPRLFTVGEGTAVHHTKRRPTPLKFRI